MGLFIDLGWFNLIWVFRHWFWRPNGFSIRFSGQWKHSQFLSFYFVTSFPFISYLFLYKKIDPFLDLWRRAEGKETNFLSELLHFLSIVKNLHCLLLVILKIQMDSPCLNSFTFLWWVWFILFICKVLDSGSCFWLHCTSFIHGYSINYFTMFLY